MFPFARNPDVIKSEIFVGIHMSTHAGLGTLRMPALEKSDLKR